MIPTIPKPIAEFEVPAYGGTVLLYSDRARWNAASKALTDEVEADDESSSGKVMRLVWPNGKSVYLAGIFVSSQSVIVHECGHIALFVCDRAGVDPTCSNGEAFCYLLDTLYTSMSQALKKRRPKRRTASQSV